MEKSFNICYELMFVISSKTLEAGFIIPGLLLGNWNSERLFYSKAGAILLYTLLC